jgi:hypothetical protein
LGLTSHNPSNPCPSNGIIDKAFGSTGSVGHCFTWHVQVQIPFSIYGVTSEACYKNMKKKKDVLRFGHQQCLPDTSFVPIFIATAPIVVINPSCANIKLLVSISKKTKRKKDIPRAQTMSNTLFVPVFVATAPNLCHKPYFCLKT